MTLSSNKSLLSEQARYILILTLLSVISLFAFSETFTSIYKLWLADDNSNYSHGLLITGLVIWFTYKRLKEIDYKIYLSINTFAVSSVLFFSLSWLIFELGNIQLGQQLALFGILIGILISLFGFKQYLTIFISSLLLILTIPVWDYLNYSLRAISISGVAQLLSLTNILFYIEGFHLTLPNGRFHVDTGCSGLNQFISGLSISIIYCLINHIKLRYSIIFVAIGVLLTLISNIIRILVIIISGYMTDMQHYFVTTDHVVLGWVVFSIIIFFYILISNRLLDYIPGLMTHKTLTNPTTPKSYTHAGIVISTVVLLTCIISGPVISRYLHSLQTTIMEHSLAMPECVGDWCQTSNKKSIDSGSKFNGADEYQSALFQKDSDQINLEIYLYQQQSQGKEAINDRNRIYDKMNWRFVRFIKNTTLEFSPKTLLLNNSNGANGIIRYWYYTNDKHLHSPIESKIQNIIGSLNSKPEILIFILTIDSAWDREQSIELLDDFSYALIKSNLQK